MATLRKPHYTAVCRRVGDWWAIEVPELRGVHTQVRRLDQAAAMARDAIALLREVEPDSFNVTVEPHLDDSATRTLAAAVEASERARDAADEASRLQRSAAATLLNDYRLTVRDTGTLLRVSPQRISQLAQPKTSRAVSATRKAAGTGATSRSGRR